MEAAGESAHVLNLFDLYWFRHLNLLPPPKPAPLASASPMLQSDLPTSPSSQVDREDAESHASEPTPAAPSSDPPTPVHRRHRRSLSEEAPSPFASLRIEPPPRLQTILSGKEGLDGGGAIALPAAEVIRSRRQERRSRGRRKRTGASKSLSKLEFEELKGFMDLGFTFSEEEAADPRLRSLVPGLQRLKRTGGSVGSGDSSVLAAAPEPEEEAPEEDAGEAEVARPYLSEAWDAAAEAEEEEELSRRIRNWRFPVPAEGVDLKDHLRLWAHTVASTVREVR